LLLTDVVDSTRLVESLGEDRAAEVWEAHDAAARELLPPHRGREIDKTDGFLLIFEDASAGASYALAYHRALASLSQRLGIGLAARAGLHLDQVILRENAPDAVALGAKPLEVEGLAKPLAARVMSLAIAGQTLLTESARAGLESLPAGCRIESHGHWRLKGVAEPVALHEFGVPGESPFAPPSDAAKVYRVVQSETGWRPARDIPHSLPAELDAFVGRSAELAELARRFEEGSRVVTLLGPGGTGKTRLATRYARAWLGDYPGGAWFCELAEARSQEGLLAAVAHALDVPLTREEPVAQLGRAIEGRGACLVILDNFEQAVEHADATLGRWLELAPEACFVVTSRERLQLRGEDAMEVEPLSVDAEAVELFELRARAQGRGFQLGEENEPAVRELVRLLDGLPLAIELAAARTRVLSPQALLGRMADRFAVLAGARGARQRQATLRAAIDWSWELLAPYEQAALAQASVFAGGFTLQGAEAVLDLSAYPEAPWVLDVVQALTDKSLLRTWTPERSAPRHAIDEPYFGMYLSIHEYAGEKLAASGAIAPEASGPEAERAARLRHGEHFAGFGAETALAGLRGRDGEGRLHALTAELDNLVTACRRAVSRGDGAVAAGAFLAAWGVLQLRGPWAVACELGEAVVALASLSPTDRARVQSALGKALQWSGRTDEALLQLERSVASCRALGDRSELARALSALGPALSGQRRWDEAFGVFEEALAIARELGNGRSEGLLLGNVAALHLAQGRADEARVLFERCLELVREAGEARYEGSALGNLGVLHAGQGRLAEAERCHEGAVGLHRRTGNRRSEGTSLHNLGRVLNERGRSAEAVPLLEQALKIARDIGARRSEAALHHDLGLLARELGRPEQARAGLERGLAAYRDIGDRRGEGLVLGGLGILHADRDHLQEARALFEQALVLHREAANRDAEAIILARLGRLDARDGTGPAARARLVEAEALADGLGEGQSPELRRMLAALREELAAIESAG
jgi:predicted ATPase